VQTQIQNYTLNRQRFFADEMGRNFQIQLKFNYKKIKIKNEKFKIAVALYPYLPFHLA
jgi:predicted transglutaminase-like protease